MSNSRCTPSLERSVFTAKAVRGAFLEGFLVFLLLTSLLILHRFWSRRRRGRAWRQRPYWRGEPTRLRP